MDETGFFAQIPQAEFDWHGRPTRLPVFYRQIRAAQVAVSMHTAEVERLLPSPRLHPLRIAPGRCLMTVAMFQYLETDIGPYEEVLVGFPCTLDHVSPQFSGSLRPLPETLMVVHWLGVSTEIALKAGDELLYTRKFMAEVTFGDRDGGWIDCRVSQDGADLLRLSVRQREMKPVPRERFEMLSVRGEHLLRWDFVTSEYNASMSRHDGDAHLEWGPHPKAREMAALKMGGIVESRYSPRLQAVLGPIMESYPCRLPA